MLINGDPFKDIPICNIRVSKNNTIITITDAPGVPKLLRSCGIEGFKNTRKGTNIAAQATAISVSTVMICDSIVRKKSNNVIFLTESPRKRI